MIRCRRCVVLLCLPPYIHPSCSLRYSTLPLLRIGADEPKQQGIAFLAFIATERIPALTEFTFDYDPEAQQRPRGASKCMCDAEKNCRGWVRT